MADLPDLTPSLSEDQLLSILEPVCQGDFILWHTGLGQRCRLLWQAVWLCRVPKSGELYFLCFFFFLQKGFCQADSSDPISFTGAVWGSTW